MNWRDFAIPSSVFMAYAGSIAIHQWGRPTVGAVILIITGMLYGYSRGSK